jgi:hypothetical protein
MPSVFLSYSREDLKIIQQLEQELKANGVSIWRDQDKIYGGDKWPKVLGEAIADRDIFLLAWSINSSTSHFVEFEWTTAIALKKHVVPCLLDSTTLPPFLAAVHGVPIDDRPKLMAALTAAIPPKDVGRHMEVVRNLGEIQATKPDEVVKAAKDVFDQRHWVVHGHVIQGQHVTVSIGEQAEKATRKFLDQWQAWVAIVSGILAATFTVLQIKERIWPPQSQTLAPSSTTEQTEARMVDQPLAGTIFGERDKRLSGVQVRLPEFRKTAMTDDNGRFGFNVKAPVGKQVELVAEKADYEPMERLASLGNEHNDFTMERRR